MFTPCHTMAAGLTVSSKMRQSLTSLFGINLQSHFVSLDISLSKPGFLLAHSGNGYCYPKL